MGEPPLLVVRLNPPSFLDCKATCDYRLTSELRAPFDLRWKLRPRLSLDLEDGCDRVPKDHSFPPTQQSLDPDVAGCGRLDPHTPLPMRSFAGPPIQEPSAPRSVDYDNPKNRLLPVYSIACSGQLASKAERLRRNSRTHH